jgi:hypothetical protein
MANGKIILNIKAAAKIADGTGGTSVNLPDGTALTIGGAIDSEGHEHVLEVYQLTTCEDNGSGTLENYTRLFVCSDRFKLTGQ